MLRFECVFALKKWSTPNWLMQFSDNDVDTVITVAERRRILPFANQLLVCDFEFKFKSHADLMCSWVLANGNVPFVYLQICTSELLIRIMCATQTTGNSCMEKHESNQNVGHEYIAKSVPFDVRRYNATTTHRNHTVHVHKPSCMTFKVELYRS